MTDKPYNLAIETSGRAGSIALGCGDDLCGVEPLGLKRRHNIGLMPTIATLCRAHDVRPAELGEVYLSLGPGSFTGLRVGMSTAKMLAMTLKTKLVGVPTLEVLAANAPDDVEHIAVCLNYKRQTMYCGVYRRTASAAHAAAVVDPALRTLDDLLDVAPRPLAIIAEKMPEAELPADVTVLPDLFAVAKAQSLWRLGRQRAKQGRFTPAATLLPLYVREPEAVTLWNQRLAAQESNTLHAS